MIQTHQFKALTEHALTISMILHNDNRLQCISSYELFQIVFVYWKKEQIVCFVLELIYITKESAQVSNIYRWYTFIISVIIVATTDLIVVYITILGILYEVLSWKSFAFMQPLIQLKHNAIFTLKLFLATCSTKQTKLTPLMLDCTPNNYERKKLNTSYIPN